MSESLTKCKGRYCARIVEHPAYLKKYGGYCFDCANSAVDELESDIADRDRQLAELRAAGLALIQAARDAHEHWDNDRDSKVGKLLSAMSGYLKGYRPELTAALAALLPPPAKEEPRGSQE